MPLSPGDAGWLQQLAFRDALRPTHSCCAPMPNRNLQSALAAHDDQADDNAVVVRLSDPKPGSIHRRPTTRWPTGGGQPAVRTGSNQGIPRPSTSGRPTNPATMHVQVLTTMHVQRAAVGRLLNVCNYAA
jgi:hypothetical protein